MGESSQKGDGAEINPRWKRAADKWGKQRFAGC